MDESQQADICRVCRSESTPDRPLFHPCICTGSIKYIHQECLVQWLRYSRKEYCELCNYRFSFTPIYSPDMPKRLPVKDIISGLLGSLATAIRFWLHYTLVAIAWLGIVPLTACRMYRCLFAGSVSSILTLPLDMLSMENLIPDILHGCLVVTCTLCAFIGLVWLREQILHGGGPDWLDQEPDQLAAAEEPDAAAGEEGQVDADVPIGEDIPPVVNVEGEDAAGPEPLVPADQNGVGAGQAADDVNWNPMDWDRAEELTWERLLGLDGSLVFLEHVCWVVSLNTLFILVFAFCPYHIGHFTVMGFKLKEYISASHFEGLLTTLCGYVIIGLSLVLLHGLTSLLKWRRIQRMLGLWYVVVKVSLLTVAEIGLFPVVCGWWMDICTLALVDATLKDRIQMFTMAPGTSMFLHWLVGIICVFYFASFVLLLREVLRPGVLWFMRNLNDPDFNPVQEMIHLPILRHLKQFIASMVVFGTLVLLMLWLPIRAIKTAYPSFLPYHIVNSTDMQMSEFSLELLLLQVILPCLLEQGHTRQWMLVALRGWCIGVAWLLGIRSYLLGDVANASETGSGPRAEANNPRGGQDEALPAAENPGVDLGGLALPGFRNGGLGAAHQALLQREGPAGFQPYLRPSFFPLKIALLLILICVSLTLVSIVALTVPVCLGRLLMNALYGDGPHHELYTGFMGLYVCWLALRAATLFVGWVPQGWSAITTKFQTWAVIGLKSLVMFSLLFGVIPLLFGLLLDLVVIVPLRTNISQSPIFFIGQDWCLGVLYTKIVCAVTMMSPDWWLKQAIERIYQNGLRNMDLPYIIWDLAVPALVALGTALAMPYVIAYGIVPLFVPNLALRALIARRIYPSCVVLVLVLTVAVWQVRQFRRLYEHIKNDKYLVGKRLVNYNHRANAENSVVQ